MKDAARLCGPSDYIGGQGSKRENKKQNTHHIGMLLTANRSILVLRVWGYFEPNFSAA